MATSEISLAPENQSFSTTISGITYQMSVIWRDTFWALDISDADGSLIIGGIPLVAGTDLLEQYRYLDFGFSLQVKSDVPELDNPTKANLGINSHLYVVTN